MILLGFEDGGFGIYDFFLWCFYAKFFRFMNLVFGFMNFICWRFHCWLKDEKIWFWVVIFYIWVLRFEKIWEDLLLGLCLCSCWRSICVCVWLTRKGKKILENLSLCSLVILLPNLNLSIFLILILLCVGMVKLGLCWYK